MPQHKTMKTNIWAWFFALAFLATLFLSFTNFGKESSNLSIYDYFFFRCPLLAFLHALESRFLFFFMHLRIAFLFEPAALQYFFRSALQASFLCLRRALVAFLQALECRFLFFFMHLRIAFLFEPAELQNFCRSALQATFTLCCCAIEPFVSAKNKTMKKRKNFITNQPVLSNSV